MILENVHISNGISKLGCSIPSVNLPAGCTCRADAPCRKKCYALKGRFAFSHTKELLSRNLEIWRDDPAFFEKQVEIAAFKSRFFRWHSAGDIPDAAYLAMMVRVAKHLSGTRFLAFTKKYELINDYISKNGSLPENLTIVLSAWGAFLPENPHNLPIAYVRLRHDACDIPSDAFQCPKYCGDCVMTGCSCWDLKNGQSVCFDEH